MLVPVVTVRGVPVTAVHVVEVVAVQHREMAAAIAVPMRVIQVTMMRAGGRGLGAIGAPPDEHNPVAADGETGFIFDAGSSVLDHAVVDLGDPATDLAKHMLVVIASALVTRQSVSKVQAFDDAGDLECPHRAEDRRVVRSGHRDAHRHEKLGDRPGVAIAGFEQPPDLVADRARPGH